MQRLTMQRLIMQRLTISLQTTTHYFHNWGKPGSRDSEQGGRMLLVAVPQSGYPEIDQKAQAPHVSAWKPCQNYTGN